MRLCGVSSLPMQAPWQQHPLNTELEALKYQCNVSLAAQLMLCRRISAYHWELAACEEVLGLASHDGGQLEQRGQRQAACRHRHQQRALARLHRHRCLHPKRSNACPSQLSRPRCQARETPGWAALAAQRLAVQHVWSRSAELSHHT